MYLAVRVEVAGDPFAQIVHDSHADVAPVDFDATAIHRLRAAQDLHQRRFARAILAEQHVNFSRIQVEVHLVERFNAGKLLLDLLHLQEWSCLRHLETLLRLAHCAV